MHILLAGIAAGCIGFALGGIFPLTVAIPLGLGIGLLIGVIIGGLA